MSEEPNRWESVYRSKEEAETSWFEDRPQVSLDLIAEKGVGKDAAIVDVWWRTSCTGSPPAASTSGMIGLRSIS